jgi:hypothetical protein
MGTSDFQPNKFERKRNHTLIIAVAAIIISLSAICLVLFRIEPITYDWMGVLVGILSMLVVILIGWQIYAFIDINSKKGDLEALSDAVSINAQKNMAASENTNWMIYHYLLLGKDPLGLAFKFLYHGILCLYHTSQYGDIKTCNVIIKGLLETIARPSEIKILDSNKDTLISLLSQTRNSKAMIGYNELLKRLSLIESG